MTTTTIRLPEDLKIRVKQAAERAGKTAHGFILDAITEKTDQETRRSDFDATAADRFARIIATGKTVSWSDMRNYLEDRLEGKQSRRPCAKKLAR